MVTLSSPYFTASSQKAKGKTIFMSSHIFEEIEEVCDRTAMIKDGKLVDIIDVYALRHEQNKHFIAVFEKVNINTEDRTAYDTVFAMYHRLSYAVLAALHE